MRGRFREASLSIGTLVVLFLGLIAMDDRVRDSVALQITNPSAELTNAGYRLEGLVTTVVQAAHDQSIGHAPLVIFVLGATVLFLFMLRT